MNRADFPDAQGPAFLRLLPWFEEWGALVDPEDERSYMCPTLPGLPSMTQFPDARDVLHSSLWRSWWRRWEADCRFGRERCWLRGVP